MGSGKGGERDGFSRSIEGGDEENRSVSPVVGIILLFGMVFIGAAIVAGAGMMLMDDLQSDATDEHGEDVLRQVDSDLMSDRGGFYLGEYGDYKMVDEGTISLNVSNSFRGEKQILTGEPLGRLQYSSGEGNTIGYQAGGIFRQTSDSSVVVSAPDIGYQTRSTSEGEVHQLDFSVTALSGQVDSGEQRATYNTSLRNKIENQMEEIEYVQTVEITVSETPYYEAWERYFEEEFGTKAQSFQGNRTATVTATVGNERPIGEYVDIEPTIYGGIYVDENGTVTQGEISVDGYDSRDGSYSDAVPDNVTDDMYVANVDEFRVKNHDAFEGYPVVSGDLWVKPQGSVSPFAYYGGEDASPQSTADYRATELSEPFEEIEEIDDEIDDAVSSLRDSAEAAPSGTIKDGVYYESSGFDRSWTSIDTTDGNVNIATDGKLDLSNVHITGGGQVHIYVGGEDTEIDLTNVTVEGDRAASLWVYGKSGAEVDVSGTFQGVVYAPGDGSLGIESGTEVYGAMVGGEHGIKDHVDVHFDQSLRSAMPIPEEDRNVSFNATRKAIDVAFVLDGSGSMSDNDPHRERVDETQNFIAMLDGEKGDRAGVYEFHTSGSRLHELSSDLESVNESVVDANANGNTDISGGLELALDDLGDGDGDREKIVILLSDGANCPHFLCIGSGEADDATIDQAHRAADEINATIHTVGLGFDNLDEELLGEIAEVTNGQNKNIDNVSDLDDVFDGLAGDVIDNDKLTFETVPLKENSNSNEQEVSFDYVEVNVED